MSAPGIKLNGCSVRDLYKLCGKLSREDILNIGSDFPTCLPRLPRYFRTFPHFSNIMEKKEAHSSDEIRITAVLAGGKSSRFGSNKALAPWGQRTVIAHIVQTAWRVSDAVYIVTNDPRAYMDLPAAIIQDTYPGKGPLSGILAALAIAPANRVFVLGCDMPCVLPEVMDHMWRITTWAPVVLPVTSRGIEPLHAIYHVALAPVILHALARGIRSVRELLQSVPHRPVSESELSPYSPDLSFLANANTQEELESLRQKTKNQTQSHRKTS